MNPSPSRGRRKDPRELVIFRVGCIKLRKGRDDDLITYLGNAPKGGLVLAIKIGLRSGIRNAVPITDDDISKDLKLLLE
jgi:hypothetical protein